MSFYVYHRNPQHAKCNHALFQRWKREDRSMHHQHKLIAFSEIRSSQSTCSSLVFYTTDWFKTTPDRWISWFNDFPNPYIPHLPRVSRSPRICEHVDFLLRGGFVLQPQDSLVDLIEKRKKKQNNDNKKPSENLTPSGVWNRTATPTHVGLNMLCHLSIGRPHWPLYLSTYITNRRQGYFQCAQFVPQRSGSSHTYTHTHPQNATTLGGCCCWWWADDFTIAPLWHRGRRSTHKHRWNELKMTVSDFRRRGKRTFRSSGAQTCVYFYGAGQASGHAAHSAQGDALFRWWYFRFHHFHSFLHQSFLGKNVT